ncbi:RNase J family beta-CASP ribonuclease [Harryflintia acetispora]|uniref:RNase J family beta-CASP ribonuclease n=1 Tax=Harryflintia acetispora TaxID=1849041 RepID=UPI001899D6A8
MAENEKNQSARAPAAKSGQGRAARPAENTNGIKQKAPAAQKRPSGTAQKQNGNKSQPQAGKKKPQEAAQKTAQAQKTEHTQKASQKNQQPKQSRGRQKQPSPVAAQELALKQRRAQKPQKQQQNLVRKTPVRIISLGGLNEIGKNMTVIECANDMFLIDCGLAFPDDDMLGVDIVIPDFTYIERNIDKLRGVVLTHGHEDHIGALPYFLAQFKVPVYGTRLTLGLVEGKLKEHNLVGKVQLNVVKPRQTVKMGCMSVEFIHVNHSIPDACALAVHTPAGVLIHTGDFKVDYTPIENDIIDLPRFGELGNKGVLLLLGESTNAERPGSTKSERSVGNSFDTLFQQAANHRIIIATFASNVHRVQQIMDAAQKYGKKVAVSGRSMVNVVTKAIELGYLTVPKGLLVEIENIRSYADGQLVIVTTGSQGEPMSALTRMAMGDHRQVTVTPNDFIIISANPIPGNEKLVGRVVNELMKLGAKVIYEKMYEVHVSGHACQDELRLIHSLTRPRFFMPVHGEYKHLSKHADLAVDMGMDRKNIIISDIGKIVETDGVDFKIVGTVPAGAVMVDGLGVGDVGSIVLRDRKHLAQDGLIVVVTTIDSATGTVVAGPDIVSRGFVYVREAEDLMNEANKVVKKTLESCTSGGVREWGNIKQMVRDDLSRFLFNRTKRSPMILPIIQEI